METLIELLKQEKHEEFLLELSKRIKKCSEKERQELLVEIIDYYYHRDKFSEYKKVFDIIIGSKLNLNFNIDHWAPSFLSLVVLRTPYMQLFDYFVQKGADINFIGDSYFFDDAETIKKEVKLQSERYMTCLDFAENKLADIFVIDYNYHIPKKEIEGHWTDYKDEDTMTLTKSEYLYLHEQSEFLFDLIQTDKLTDHIKKCGGKTYTELQKNKTKK